MAHMQLAQSCLPSSLILPLLCDFPLYRQGFLALGSTLSDRYMNTPDTLIQNHMVSLLLSFTFNLPIHCNLREFHENDILLDHGFIFLIYSVNLCHLGGILDHLHVR